MKQQIHDTILDILSEKRANGDVLPFATSIEVAHLLNVSADVVESTDVDGIFKELGLDNNWYYYE